MRRRIENTRLMVDASRVLQEMVGMLSNPERGAAIVVSGHISRRVASGRTRNAKLKVVVCQDPFRIPVIY